MPTDQQTLFPLRTELAGGLESAGIPRVKALRKNVISTSYFPCPLKDDKLLLDAKIKWPSLSSFGSAQQPMEHGHVEGAASHLQSLHSHSLNQKYLGISPSSKQHNTKTLYKNIVKGPHISIDNHFILIHIFNSFLTSALVYVC